eukprot:gene16548-18878_t
MTSWAQAQTIEINPVVISATRVEQKLSNVIPSATVITRAEIERAQAPTLVDLLQGQPGIEIGRNGGPGTYSSIFMRGQNSNNVAVYIDGVRVQTDSIGALRLVDMPPNQIEKVEILRGNMGAVYGDSAVGGVINIFTRAGAGSFGPTASVSYGSRNTSDVGLGYNTKGEDFRLGISVHKFDTDGYSAMQHSQNPTTVNPDKDAFKRHSIFLNGEKMIGKDLAIGFQINNIESKADYDSTSNPKWGPASTNDKQNNKQNSSDVTGYSKFNLSTAWSSRVGLTESKFKNSDFYNGAANGQFDGEQRNIQWSNVYRLGHGNVTFGADGTNTNFKTTTEYNRKSLGYYAGYSGLYEKLDYQINLRHDQVKSKSTSTSIDKSANTWLLGLGYLLTEKFKLTGLVSTSFRAPNTAELFDVPAWGTTGNLNLKPEEHKGLELGASYATELGTLRLVRFESKTTNAIAYKSGTPSYENIGLVENKGYETGFSGVSNGWVYKLSAVHQDPINAQTGARLARRAREYGSIYVGKTLLGIDWGTQIVASGNRVDETRSLESYTLVHFSAAKKMTPEWTGRIKIENAFDQKYQLAYGYDTPPRGVFVSMQYQPK